MGGNFSAMGKRAKKQGDDLPCALYQLRQSNKADLQAWHRTRSLFVKHRTAVINQIRGLLAEYGLRNPRRRSGRPSSGFWMTQRRD